MQSQSTVDINFDEEINIILGIEGGYSNDQDDRGGETNRGITQNTYNLFQKKYSNKLKPMSVKDLNISDTKEFYKLYLLDCKVNQITNKRIRIQFADATVHHSAKLATEFAQNVLGLKADGIFGSQTREALNQANEFKFQSEFIEERRKHFQQMIKNDPKQKKFENGWNKRLNKLKSL